MAAPNAVAIVAVPMAANPWMDLNAARGPFPPHPRYF
jgi:hypothetical protein